MSGRPRGLTVSGVVALAGLGRFLGVKGTPIVGIVAVVGWPQAAGAVVYNAASVLHDGRVARTYRKRGLPNYAVFHDRRYFDVDRIVDTLGNVPPELMYSSFDMLRPVSQVAGRLRLWDNMWNDEFVASYRRFDRWTNDQIPFPGECFRQTVKELQQGNKLIEGEVYLGDERVDLKNVVMPVLNVYAAKDHLVPPASSKALEKHCGSRDYSEFSFKGGHIGIYVSGRAQKEVPPAIADWLKARG